MVSISFAEMFGAYSRLLRDNPGKALKLNGNEIAILMGDELCYVTMTEDGSDFFEINGFDPRVWEDLEDASKIIANPTFVDVGHLNFNRDD
jgi:hypothetical protein